MSRRQLPLRRADPAIRANAQYRGRALPGSHFAIAILSVGFAVWWVMDQRMPDIDPRDVIVRNLNLARTAMADGRYTDPSERSAFHYFSTVLALDPANADAIAGIDAIADRHCGQCASAAVSRANCGGRCRAGESTAYAARTTPVLAALDTQWRAELRQLLQRDGDACQAQRCR